MLWPLFIQLLSISAMLCYDDIFLCHSYTISSEFLGITPITISCLSIWRISALNYYLCMKIDGLLFYGFNCFSELLGETVVLLLQVESGGLLFHGWPHLNYLVNLKQDFLLLQGLTDLRIILRYTSVTVQFWEYIIILVLVLLSESFVIISVFCLLCIF